MNKELKDAFFNHAPKQSFWERILGRVYWMWISFGSALNQAKKEQTFIVEAKDSVTTTIKDDIEFGYDLEMIYSKIMAGSYENTPIPKEENYFLNTGMNWEDHHRKLWMEYNLRHRKPLYKRKSE